MSHLTVPPRAARDTKDTRHQTRLHDRCGKIESGVVPLYHYVQVEQANQLKGPEYSQEGLLPLRVVVPNVTLGSPSALLYDLVLGTRGEIRMGQQAFGGVFSRIRAQRLQ